MRNFFVCEPGPTGGISIIFIGDSARDCLDFVAKLDERRQNECEIYERQEYVDFPLVQDEHKDRLKKAIAIARNQALGGVTYVAISNTSSREQEAKAVIYSAFDALEQVAL